MPAPDGEVAAIPLSKDAGPAKSAPADDYFDRSMFRYVWRNCRGWQIFLISVAMATQPFYLYSLQLPKQIINFLTEMAKTGEVPAEYASLWPEAGPLIWLGALCAAFLATVAILGEAKRQSNILVGRVGELMLRRLRFQLLKLLFRFPIPRLQRTGQGRLVAMIIQETEPLGGFIGEMYALPALQGGLLLSALSFIVIQNPLMGLAAILLYPLQIYLIPRLQKQVNILARQRVEVAREMGERIGEVVSAPATLHTAIANVRVLSQFTEILDRLYVIRLSIFRRKYFIKFLNNFLAQFTPFLLFLGGGYLVLDGQLTLGALTAAILAYKDLSPPWKELLGWYQRKEDTRVKYEQLIEQFDLPDLAENEPLIATADLPEQLPGELVLSNICLNGEGELRLLDSVSFVARPGEIIAIIGDGGSGKGILGQLIAGILRADSGRILVGERNLGQLPRLALSRRIGYVGPDAGLLSGTVYENIVMPIASRPAPISENMDQSQQQFARRARASGNLPFDLHGDWTEPAMLGLPGENPSNPHDTLKQRLSASLDLTLLEPELIEIVLNRAISPADEPELTETLLSARAEFRKRMKENPRLANFVEIFHPDLYNNNSTMAQNILFGTPTDKRLNIDELPGHPYMRSVLRDVGLLERCEQAGVSAAALLVEIFSDLPPGHRFFSRYGFIDHDSLPELKALVARAERQGVEQLATEERAKMLGFAFRLTPGRHRLGVINDPLRAEILKARHHFAEHLPAELQDAIAFFDPERYNGAMTIENNLLFGHIAYGQATAGKEVREVILEILSSFDLRSRLLFLSLDFQVGLNGANLNGFQRQKLVLARELIKRPDILVMNEGLTALDGPSQAVLRERVHAALPDAIQLWIAPDAAPDQGFHRAISMRDGRIVGDDDLTHDPSQEETLSGDKDDKKETGPETQKLLPLADLHNVEPTERKLRLLAHIPLFSGLDRQELQLLSQISEFITLAAGEVLFSLDDVADAAYVAIDGDLAIFLPAGEGPDANGKEQEIRRVAPGEVIGEVGVLMDDVRRSATIRALTTCHLLSVPRDPFLALLREHVDITFSLLLAMTSRLSQTTRLLNKFAQSQA